MLRSILIRRVAVSDILPVYLDEHDFVSQQRKEQCEDLSSTLRVLQINTNNQKSHVFLYMRTLEMGRLKLNYQQEVRFCIMRELNEILV